jgi:hypothetical protein
MTDITDLPVDVLGTALQATFASRGVPLASSQVCMVLGVVRDEASSVVGSLALPIIDYRSLLTDYHCHKRRSVSAVASPYHFLRAFSG